MGAPRSSPGDESSWLRDVRFLPWHLQEIVLLGGRGFGTASPRCPSLVHSPVLSAPRSCPLRGEDRDLPAVLAAGRLLGGRGCALAHQLHRGLRVPIHPGEGTPVGSVGGGAAPCPHSLPQPQAKGDSGNRGAPSARNNCRGDKAGHCSWASSRSIRHTWNHLGQTITTPVSRFLKRAPRSQALKG